MKIIIITDKVGESYGQLLSRITSSYKKIAAFMALTIVSLLVGNTGVIPGMLEIISPVFAVLTASTGLMIHHQRKQLRKLRSGLDGELQLRHYLKSALSDEWTAFLGVPVSGHGDIDCLIVSHNGVFALDAKNHTGIIYSSGKDLAQQKIGRGGNRYNGDLSKQQPAAKLAARIHNFKEVLSNNHIRAWVEGIIVFTNPSVKIQAESVRGFKILRLKDLADYMMASTSTNHKYRHAALEKYLFCLAQGKHPKYI